MATAMISAPEAVRTLSELLSGIRYRGDHYTIQRAGRPIATIGLVEPVPSTRTLADLPTLVRSLPRLDPDDTSFADDVAASWSEPFFL